RLYFSPLPLLIPTTPRPQTSTLFPYTTLFRSKPMTDDVRFSVQRRKLLAGLGAAAIGGVTASAVGRAAPAPAQESERSAVVPSRSEEHTSELQSRENLVCRLLLEKKKKKHKC